MKIYALLFTFLSGILITIGFIMAKISKKKKTFTQLAISMAFGVIIMLSFFEILKEAIEILKEETGSIYFIWILGFTLIGVVFLKILDIFIPDHEAKNESENLYHIGVVSCIAVLLHNILEGMTIYTTTTTDFKMGLLMVIGVGLHNIPMGMVIYSTLSKTKKTRHKKLIYLLLVTFSTLLGGFLMSLASKYITDLFIGLLLCITLGMLFYIAVFELLHEILEFKNHKLTIIGIIIGIGLFSISACLG